jgi:hypothetical protein
VNAGISARKARWIALLAVAALAACYPELDWREFAWPEGGFAVLLPGKPHRETRDVAFAGSMVRMQMFAVQVSGMAFGVAYADLPKGADANRTLAEGRDALLRNVAADRVSQRAVEIPGAQGIEIEALGGAPDAQRRLAARVLIAGSRYYQIAFIGRDERAAAVDTALYLGSFKLLK